MGSGTPSQGAMASQTLSGYYSSLCTLFGRSCSPFFRTLADASAISSDVVREFVNNRCCLFVSVLKEENQFCVICKSGFVYVELSVFS